jgi:hypothetical protein
LFPGGRRKLSVSTYFAGNSFRFRF